VKVRWAAVAAALSVALLAGGYANADSTCAAPGCSGAVSYPWIAPGSAEVLNSVAGNGTFGYSIDPGTVAAWAGKTFRLTYASTTADLDVYFYVPSNADAPWDFTTGVKEGPGRAEQGSIPSGTQRALVMISYTTPTESAIPFTFTVQ
jgi:hypothetical protein